MTTHSNVSNVIEFGVLFKDKSGTFWNQVDTVLSPATIAGTLKHCGSGIDLLFAMYASQNFGFFDSKPAAFPFAMHEMNLRSVLAIRPRVVVPGSAGFRFCGPVAWCNAFLFPVSREKFVADLAALEPAIKAKIANPGDLFEISPGNVTHRRAASSCATTIEDDTAELRFDLSAPIPPLTDPNPDGYPDAHMARAVEAGLSEFREFVRGAYASNETVVAEYRACRASYAVGVLYPDQRETWCRIQFDENEPRIEMGDAARAPADAVHRIAASALTAWLSRERTYFYLRAFSRKYACAYVLSNEGGKVSVAPKELPDLLGHFLSRMARGANLAMKTWLDLQLKPYIAEREK
jgi:hypothetical protein